MTGISASSFNPRFSGVVIKDTLDIPGKKGHLTFNVVPDTFQAGLTYNNQTVPSADADRLTRTMASSKDAIALLTGPNEAVSATLSTLVRQSTVPRARQDELVGAIKTIHDKDRSFASGSFITADGEIPIVSSTSALLANAFTTHQFIYHGTNL